MWTTWTSIALWKRALIALALGFAAGMLLKENAIFLKPIGDIFIRLLRMMILPLIFVTVIFGIVSLENTSRLASIALKAILWFAGTTLIATTIALFVTDLFNPGAGIVLETAETVVAKEPPTLASILVNIIPSNPFQSFLETNILQVLFLSVVIGMAIVKTKGAKEKLSPIINTINDVISYIINIIIEIMPIGIFALIAYTSSVWGLDLMIKLMYIILLALGVSLFHMFVVFGAILKAHKVNIIEFYKHAVDAILVAFSTSSSAATLPTTFNCARKMNIPKEVSGFVLPLGATINMNGTAIYQAVCVVFIAQIVGFDLTLHHYFIVMITTLIAAIGTAGVPGAGIIMLGLVLNSVGLPLEGVAIIAGVDRILDMIRTSLNIAGDLLVSRILSN